MLPWYSCKRESFDVDPVRFRVRCNTDWKINIGNREFDEDSGYLLNDWLWGTQISGTAIDSEDGQLISFIPEDYNIGSHANSIDLLFQSAAEMEYHYTVKQNNQLFEVADSEGITESVFASCNLSESYSFRINSEFDHWEVIKSPDWIQIEPENGETGETEVKLIVSKNAISDPRGGDLVIACWDEGNANRSPEENLTLSQAAYKFSFKGSEIELNNNVSYLYNITFFSSGAWKLVEETLPDWIEVANKEGYGMEYGESTEGAILQIKAKDINYDEKPRTASIKIQCIEPDCDMEPATFKLIQKEYLLEADLVSGTEIPTTSHSKEFTLKSTGEWRLECDADWMEFTKYNGSGHGKLRYDVDANDGAEERIANITVYSKTHEDVGKELTRTYQIVQPEYRFEVTSPKDIRTLEFSAIENKPSGDFQIECSAQWRVESDVDWINPSVESGEGNGSLTIQVDNNYASKSRQGTFEIWSEFNEKRYSEKYTVNQKEFVFDKETVESGPYSGLSTDVSITIENSSADWYVHKKPEWIEIVEQKKFALKIRLADYVLEEPAEPRKGDILVRSTYYAQNNELEKVITVSQEPYLFGLSQTEVTIPSGQTEVFVEITCSDVWTAIVSSDSDWLACATTGYRNGRIKITASGTVSLKRQATIKVTSKGLEKEITVIQEATK